MLRILAVLAAAFLVTAPALATEQTDAMAAAKQFVDGFNKGDIKSAVAACADQTSIIDDFAPHHWNGPGACAKWADDFGAFAKANGVTDGVVTLGKARHVDVTGDRAYIVSPAIFAYKLKGKPVKEGGATFTFALQKGATGWRIVGWTWAKG